MVGKIKCRSQDSIKTYKPNITFIQILDYSFSLPSDHMQNSNAINP